MRSLFAVALVSALLLAGCSDPAKTDDPVLTTVPTTMSIVGLVQDEAFNAVGGANVTLRLVGRNTTTDAGGAFRFDGLTPSAYLVDVNATGFEFASLTAEPQGAQNASLNFVLSQLTSFRPRTEVTHLEGILQCAAEYGIITGSCDTASTTFGGPGVFSDTSTFQVGLLRRWQSIVIDVDFDGESNPGLEALRLVVRGVNDADKLNEYQQYGRFSGAGPFTARRQPHPHRAGRLPSGARLAPGLRPDGTERLLPRRRGRRRRALRPLRHRVLQPAGA